MKLALQCIAQGKCTYSNQSWNFSGYLHYVYSLDEI